MSKEQTPPRIRPGMLPDDREGHQHSSPQFLDKFLLEAFTATDRRGIELAEHRLNDIQAQCLKHICWLSEIEEVCRSREEEMYFDMNEKEFNELVIFLSGIGAGLVNITQQLGLVRFNEQGKVVTSEETV